MPLPAILAGLARAATAAAQAAGRGMAAMAQASVATAQAGGGYASRAYQAAGGMRGMAASAMNGMSNMPGGIAGQASETARSVTGGPNGASAVAELGKGLVMSGLQGGIVGVGIEMTRLPGKIKQFGDAILEVKRPLAELSGSLAATFMELDADRFRRNVRLAQSTSGSTSGLAKAQSRLEERLLPFQTAFTNFSNFVQEKMTNGVEILLEIGKNIPLVGRAIDKWANDKDKAEKQTLVDLSQQMARGDFARRQHPPLPPMRERRDR